MEEGRKKQKSLRTRFRDCFGGGGVAQSRVPLDIWKHILLITDLRSLSRMAQTSKPFYEVVREDIRVNNWELARRYRREGQIPLALKCLKSCVEHNHPDATFHMAFAQYHGGGWGLGPDYNESLKYTYKAIALGNQCALLVLSRLKSEITSLYNITDSFAVGFFHYICHNNDAEAFKYFKDSAHRGNEFAQYYLGCLYHRRVDGSVDKGIEWITKSAEQGYGRAQLYLAKYQDREKWLSKAQRQSTCWV